MCACMHASLLVHTRVCVCLCGMFVMGGCECVCAGVCVREGGACARVPCVCLKCENNKRAALIFDNMEKEVGPPECVCAVYFVDICMVTSPK